MNSVIDQRGWMLTKRISVLAISTAAVRRVVFWLTLFKGETIW